MFNDDEAALELPKNKYLYKPYGTANSWQYKQNGGIILSPSGITKFFNNAEGWYQDRTGVPTFNGNTNTALGNAIHASIESLINGDGQISNDEISLWMLNKFTLNPDVDTSEVIKYYGPMLNQFTKEYLSKVDIDSFSAVECEVELEENSYPLKISTMGTADAIINKHIIVDWKTIGNKPKGIGNYKFQLMQYARAMKKTGMYDIDTIKIVYIQKATKTIPPRIYEFTHKITAKDWIEADYFTELMVNTLLLSHNNPELQGLIFRPNPISMW